MKFIKYQGIGNDFIIIDTLSEYHDVDFLYTDTEIVERICKRRFGIGADGLILILKAENNTNTIAKMEIINSDGSIPEMCGNGMRCLVRYLKDNTNLIKGKITKIQTRAGIIESVIEDSGEITVNMGAPIFSPLLIPTTLETNTKNVPYGDVILDNKKYEIYSVGMGNPHLIIYIDSLELINIKEWGTKLENDSRFPLKTNVHFVEIINKKLIKIKVWERGAGETLACGTGACATLAISTRLGLCNNQAQIILPGGNLNISWPNSSGPIFMSGIAKRVFTGNIYL